MGILATGWTAEHAGHSFSIHRNELTKGFELRCDGVVVARKAWSLVGLGALEGQLELSGRTVPVRVSLGLAGAARCRLWIDGVEVPCQPAR
jgi:hypothetical protein